MFLYGTPYVNAQNRGSAVATYLLPTGVQAVVYIDKQQHIDQVFYQTGAWQVNDLTAATQTPVAVWGSPLATYVLPNGVQAVAYIDINRHVDQLFFQQNQWLWNDLTAATGAPLTAFGSALATYVLPNGVQAIAYIDLNHHVDQVFYQQSQWLCNDLTLATGAPLGVTQTSLATYVLPNAVQAIAYIDRTQHVDQVFYQNSQWLVNDLTAIVNAPIAALGSSLATYVLPDAVQSVVFCDQRQHVDQIFFQGNQWNVNDLTAIVNAPIPQLGTALATYVLQNGVQAIVYLDQQNNVDQIFFQGNQWNVNDLTPFTNAPTAVFGSALATYVLQNGVQAIAFVDISGNIDQLYYQNGNWQYQNLSAATHAPAANTGSSFSPATPLQEYIRMGGVTVAIENQ